MKYQVDKNRLAKFLSSRPALIRNVPKLTEAFIIKIFNQDFRHDRKRVDLYRNLPIELKTLAVTRAFMNDIPYWGLDYSDIPQNIRDLFTKDDRAKFIERRSSYIDDFDNPTQAEWEHAIEKGYNNYTKIPEKMWSKKLYLRVAKQRDYSFDIKIDPSIWDEKFALDLIKTNHKTLSIVPKQFITNAVLREGVGQDLTKIDIPSDAWCPETVEKALSYNTDNIKVIPQQYHTKEMILICAKDGMWDDLPYRDYETLVAWASGSHSWGSIPESAFKMAQKVNPNKFIPDVIKMDGDVSFIKNQLRLTIDHEMWLKLIALKPVILKEIPKTEQTEAMVDTFIMNADAGTLDSLANYINLGKVKAIHAPMLINCKSGLLIEIVNKFLKGDDEEGNENTIEFEMSPAQFSKVRSLLT